MIVLHLSLTPLIGAPLRICKALRGRGIDARCAVLSADIGDYARRTFDQDLQWANDRDEIIDLARRCDVLHLHNFVDLESTQFAPIDIASLWKTGKPMLRHFHSTPQTIARFMKTTPASVLACPIPKLSIAQYPARFYRSAKLVPNIVLADELHRSLPAREGALRIAYAPTRFNSARSDRWDTKAYPETVKLLRKVVRDARRRGIDVELDIIEFASHAECLARKARCHVVIDDLATGSYHLNTLESLAAGSVCLTYMDHATRVAMTEITGRADFPALNVGLEDAAAVLRELLAEPSLVEGIGSDSRRWMQQYWAPDRMVQHFIEAYEQVMSTPGQPFRDQQRESSPAAQWQEEQLQDIIWVNRSARWPKIMPEWMRRMRGLAGTSLRRIGLR